MRELKLKHCPFCGGQARYRRGGQDWEADRPWAAGCAEGHAESPEMDTMKDAAWWWNRRPKASKEKRQC